VAQAETILLAEDDSDDVLFIGMAFEKAGFAIPMAVVSDGAQAIDYLKGDGLYSDRSRFPKPTLMLLDLKLPRASGFEVLEWIRHRPEWIALPIIILTSSISDADMKRAYDLGANFFLSKPVRFDDLVQTIKELGAYGLSDAFLSVPGPFAVPQAAQRGANSADTLR
jgi:CheY-like chemotaxis protein